VPSLASLSWQAIIAAVTACGAALAVVGRYVFKVERSFADQRVINEKHIAACDLLLERIEHVGVVAETNHTNSAHRLDELCERVERLEQQVAFGHPRQ
jgi:hypothetical protein